MSSPFRISCKVGSLQIDDTSVQIGKREPIWQIPRGSITRIGVKRGVVMADVAFYASDGNAYVAEFIGKVDVDKMLKLFPGAEVVALTEVPKVERPAPPPPVAGDVSNVDQPALAAPVAVGCKGGRLHVDGTTVAVTTLFNKPVWSVATASIMQVIRQKSSALLSVDLTFVATTGLYPAPEIGKTNIEKILAYFPGLVSELPPGDLWYLDPTRLTYLATYTNEADAQRELEAAAQHGWMPQDTASTAGHINVGRTAAKVALLGPISLVTGASRSKDKLTITFVRTPDWIEAHKA